MPKGETLSPIQQRFVDEYLVDMNATKAYIRAGYKSQEPTKNAVHIMRNALVSAAIKEALEDISKKTNISRQWVETRAIVALEDALRDGEHSSVVRAIEFLAKLNGHIIDRSLAKVIHSIADLSDAELGALKIELLRRIEASKSLP